MLCPECRNLRNHYKFGVSVLSTAMNFLNRFIYFLTLINIFKFCCFSRLLRPLSFFKSTFLIFLIFFIVAADAALIDNSLAILFSYYTACVYLESPIKVHTAHVHPISRTAPSISQSRFISCFQLKDIKRRPNETLLDIY